MVRKASKLSFAMSRKDKDKDKDRTGETSLNGSAHKEKEKRLPGRPSGGAVPGPTFGETQSSGSSSFFNVSSNAPTVHPDDASATLQPDDSPGRSHSPARSKNLPPESDTARYCRGDAATATAPTTAGVAASDWGSS